MTLLVLLCPENRVHYSTKNHMISQFHLFDSSIFTILTPY
jgi:hypothetical protein